MGVRGFRPPAAEVLGNPQNIASQKNPPPQRPRSTRQAFHVCGTFLEPPSLKLSHPGRPRDSGLAHLSESRGVIRADGPGGHVEGARRQVLEQDRI